MLMNEMVSTFKCQQILVIAGSKNILERYGET